MTIGKNILRQQIEADSPILLGLTAVRKEKICKLRGEPNYLLKNQQHDFFGKPI